MKNVGGTIRALRQEKGITLPALADRSSLSKGLLSKIENSDESNPSLDTLYKIAEALDEPLATLLETEQVQLKRVTPNEPPAWQKPLIAYLQSQGKRPDPDILSAMYILRNRKAAKTADLETWKFLYLSIENSFKAK
jgi:transcriptional regulator with XRE-family HTH domain